MPADVVAFGYAAMIAAGGVFGYVKSHSIPSLAAGLLFGSVLGYGAYETSQDPKKIGVLLGGSALLTGMMGFRYYNTRKIMPAGIITLLSAVMVVRTMANYFTTPMKTK